MNIFALDLDPQKAAQYHCDKHAVKMILESAQMVSTIFDKYQNHQDYMIKPCFQNHPCTIWAGRSYENLLWLINLGNELTKEYTFRYKRIHKYDNLFRLALNHASKFSNKFPEKNLQPFAIAMPDYLKNQANDSYDFIRVVNLYREYYILEKSRFAIWKYSEMPDWYRKDIRIKKKMILENHLTRLNK